MDPISEYQKWKEQGESLRSQAKQAMESRFRELLLEAAGIAQEYHRDFGAALKPPPTITTFRYKASNAKAKKTVKSAAPKAGGPAKQSEAHAKQTGAAAKQTEATDPRVVSLLKKRAQIQKKLEAAKSAGKPTKNLDDQLYEVEDDLRLAGHAA
jgi:hypothetical protein